MRVKLGVEAVSSPAGTVLVVFDLSRTPLPARVLRTPDERLPVDVPPTVIWRVG